MKPPKPALNGESEKTATQAAVRKRAEAIPGTTTAAIRGQQPATQRRAAAAAAQRSKK